jgi:predicted ATP-dependent endonuclease of OLD family
MKLTKLGLENVQGMTGNFHFKDVTVITGGNGSGKTTLVKAIRFALAGELPVLGKSGRSTWRMASDQTKDGKMQIGLQTDTGLHVTHSWDRKDGKVSYNASIPAEVKWPAAMLDFRTFLSMRAADQAEALFNLCPNKAGKGDAISKILEVTTFNPDVSNAVLDDLSNELQALKAQKLQDWLTVMEWSSS